MQGRLQGKRRTARHFLDHVVEHGAEACNYLPAVDVEMHTVGSHALVAATTEAQGAMADLISYIAHPPEVLAWSNAQPARLVDCLQSRDSALAMRTMADHLRGTEHVLAGLLP
jgi:hypothetical protein